MNIDQLYEMYIELEKNLLSPESNEYNFGKILDSGHKETISITVPPPSHISDIGLTFTDYLSDSSVASGKNLYKEAGFPVRGKLYNLVRRISLLRDVNAYKDNSEKLSSNNEESVQKFKEFCEQNYDKFSLKEYTYYIKNTESFKSLMLFETTPFYFLENLIIKNTETLLLHLKSNVIEFNKDLHKINLYLNSKKVYNIKGSVKNIFNKEMLEHLNKFGNDIVKNKIKMCKDENSIESLFNDGELNETLLYIVKNYSSTKEQLILFLDILYIKLSNIEDNFSPFVQFYNDYKNKNTRRYIDSILGKENLDDQRRNSTNKMEFLEDKEEVKKLYTALNKSVDKLKLKDTLEEMTNKALFLIIIDNLRNVFSEMPNEKLTQYLSNGLKAKKININMKIANSTSNIDSFYFKTSTIHNSFINYEKKSLRDSIRSRLFYKDVLKEEVIYKELIWYLQKKKFKNKNILANRLKVIKTLTEITKDGYVLNLKLKKSIQNLVDYLNKELSFFIEDLSDFIDKDVLNSIKFNNKMHLFYEILKNEKFLESHDLKDIKAFLNHKDIEKYIEKLLYKEVV